MSGFGKVTFISEYYNQSIVNIFRFRSAGWLWNTGNPFDDVLEFVDAVVTKYKTAYLALFPGELRFLRAEGVGYDDGYNIITSSPIVRTIAETGTMGTGVATNGAAVACNLSLRCGEQSQIYGTGKSLRNRGYLSIPVLNDAYVDNYSHVTDTFVNGVLSTFAQLVDDEIPVVTLANTLVPVRIHEKWQRLPAPLPDVLLWRTYSDVKGYVLPRVVSNRRSRRPEA